jgi:hypothetical protein
MEKFQQWCDSPGVILAVKLIPFMESDKVKVTVSAMIEDTSNIKMFHHPK